MEEKKERRNRTTKSVGNGEGTLYYSEKLEKWVYQYYIEGNPKRQTMTQRKHEQVKEFKARVTKLKNSLNTGTFIKKSQDTVEEIISSYIEQKKIDNKISLATYKRTLETKNQLKKCCHKFINKPIQKVIVEDVEQSKIELKKYSQSCINKMWILLYNAFKIAYSRKKIPYNIMDDETLTKPISDKATKRVEALTITEQKHLENILNNEEKDNKYSPIVKAQLISAMRIGELLARSIKDYNPKEKLLHIHNTLTVNDKGQIIIGKHTKTYNKFTGEDMGERYLTLSGKFQELDNIIREQLSNKQGNINGLIFWDYEKNNFFTHGALNSWLQRINSKYKITNKQLSSHVLRHTAITRWREQNVDMKVIQYWAGHVEGSTITDKFYVSISKEFIEQEQRKLM